MTWGGRLIWAAYNYIPKYCLCRYKPGSLLWFPRPKWNVPAVSCSVHCSYTAAYAVYLQSRLPIHCWHTAYCSVHCAYTVFNFRNCRYTPSTLLPHSRYCGYTAFCSVHCKYGVEWSLMAAFLCTAPTLPARDSVCAVFLQCTCSVHCSYTETILPIHSTSVWVTNNSQVLPEYGWRTVSPSVRPHVRPSTKPFRAFSCYFDVVTAWCHDVTWRYGVTSWHLLTTFGQDSDNKGTTREGHQRSGIFISTSVGTHSMHVLLSLGVHSVWIGIQILNTEYGSLVL